jgi:hypothetical protein
MAPPPFERRFGSDASTLGKAKQMNSRSGPPTVVHEVVEHIRDIIDCRRWIGVCQDIAERVEGRVPLERVLVQIWYPLCPPPQRRMWDSSAGLFILFFICWGFGGRGEIGSVLISKKDNLWCDVLLRCTQSKRGRLGKLERTA